MSSVFLSRSRLIAGVALLFLSAASLRAATEPEPAASTPPEKKGAGTDPPGFLAAQQRERDLYVLPPGGEPRYL